MTTITSETLRQKLCKLDGGVLRCGSHTHAETPAKQSFCALEFESQVRGRKFSDKPLTLPDLRPLNDAPWSSDEVMTEALLPVMAALWRWAEWSDEQRQQWTTRVTIETIRQIIAELPGIPSDMQARCRDASTLQEAQEAASAVGSAASGSWEGVRAAVAAAGAWAANAVRTTTAQSAVVSAASAAAAAARAAAREAEAAECAMMTTAPLHDTILARACVIWIESAQIIEAAP